MDQLRLILLLIGIVVIAGVYLWGHLQGRTRPLKRTSPARPPATDNPDTEAIERELARMQETLSARAEPSAAPAADAAAATAKPADIEDLVVISVVSGSEQPFPGEALARAFANNKLTFGDKRIFHRIDRQGGRDVSVFGVANLFKPGDFGDGDLEGFETAGITLFLELPAPIDGLQAFDDFVQTAERLAVELGGQLQDRSHCVVTHQALMQKRELLARSRLRIPLPA